MTTTGLDVVRGYRELVAGGRLDEALAFLSEQLDFLTPDGDTQMTFFVDPADAWAEAGAERP